MNRLAIWKFSATAAVALAAAAVPGFAVNASSGEPNAAQPERAARSAQRAEQMMERGRAERALRFAEEAVAFEPLNSAHRSMLGQVYMASGRFMSAAQSFADARELGATDSRTIVGHALALVAIGRDRDAVSLLDASMSDIPASDYGLALALAGEGQRGALVLVDVARSADATARDRQNLALAMASAGRWMEAQLIAAQDVGGEVASQRIQQWAAMLQAGDPRLRIAGVIGTSPVEDPGLPVRLALNGAANPVGALAATDDPAPLGLYAPAPPTEAAAVDAPLGAEAPVEMAMAEMPAAPMEAAAASAAPVEPVEVAAAPAPVTPVEMAAAAVMPAEMPAAVQNVVEQALTFVSIPVIQPLRNAIESTMAALRVEAPAPVRRAGVAAVPAPARDGHRDVQAPRGAVRTSGWAVQLGAYDTVGVAREAWGRLARQHAALGARDGVSTVASVRGRTFYRLSATGFASRAEAMSACANVAGSGGNCFVRQIDGSERVQWASRQTRTQVAANGGRTRAASR